MKPHWILLAIPFLACVPRDENGSSHGDGGMSLDGGTGTPGMSDSAVDGSHDSSSNTVGEGGPDGAMDGGDEDDGSRDGGDASAGSQSDGGTCPEGASSASLLAGNLSASDRAVAQGDTLLFLSTEGTMNSILAVPKAGGAPTTIVPATTEIRDLAVDGANVYFTTPGSVLKCPLTGCGGSAPVGVASIQVNPKRIVTDGGHVYYTTDTAIMKCAVSGCGSSATVFAAIGSGTVDLALDSTSLYWTNQTDAGTKIGKILSCPLSGCVAAPNVLAADQDQPSGVSTDGPAVFWQDASGSVLTCPVAGCTGTPALLARSPDGPGLKTFLGGADVYWGSRGRIYRCAATGCNGKPNIVGNSGPIPGLLNPFAADATGFYWIEASGKGVSSLLKCPPCGCDGAPRVEVGQSGATADVITAGTRIYWIDEGNRINIPATLYACSASDCANTVTKAYAVPITDPVVALSALLLAGDYLYFSQGGYAGSNNGTLMRCTASTGCDDAAPAPMYPPAITHSVGGKLVGLAGGATVTLQNKGGNNLTLNADGSFVFSTAVASGSTFAVSVLSQSPTQCTVYGGTGVVGYGNVTSVVVNCTPATYIVDGTVAGWLSSKLVLSDGTSTVTMNGSGSFAFPKPVAGGTAYSVTITEQPVDTTCTVRDGSGTSAEYANVEVTCLAGQQSGLSSDGTYLYWMRDLNPQNGAYTRGAIVRVPLDGGIPLVLASGLVGVGVSSTVLDANHVYFSAWEAGTVNRIPKAGGAVTPIATGLAHPTSLVLSGTTLYWITDDRIYSLDVAGATGTPVAVAPSTSKSDPTYHAPSTRLAVSNNLLYWIDEGVWRATLSGGTPLLRVRAPGLAGGIAIASGNLFFGATVPALMSKAQ